MLQAAIEEREPDPLARDFFALMRPSWLLREGCDLSRTELREIPAGGIARSLVAIAFADDPVWSPGWPHVENERGCWIRHCRDNHERQLIFTAINDPFCSAERPCHWPRLTPDGLRRRGFLLRLGWSGRQQ